MYKAYKFRLYPNNNQEILINKIFGCTRFIYNYFLSICNENNKYNKTKKRLAILYKKIQNTRRHNIINITNEIVSNYDVIVSEKLNVKGMMQNHRIALQVSDASFNKICERIKWKCKLSHKYYYQVDTYYPSSKTCSRCGYKTDITNNLNIRKWECSHCHNENDRDINASINIMFEGLKLHYKNLLYNN